MFDPSFLFWGVAIIYIYHIESGNGREKTLYTPVYMIHPLNSWPRGPLVIFPSCWDCSKLLAIPELRINHRMGEDKWVHDLLVLADPLPHTRKKLQNCVQHWHCNANLKFQGSNLKTAVEFAFETHGADNRQGWVGPVLTEAQTCNLPLLWANMFGLRTRIQRTSENRMKPGLVVPSLVASGDSLIDAGLLVCVCVGEISYF